MSFREDPWPWLILGLFTIATVFGVYVFVRATFECQESKCHNPHARPHMRDGVCECIEEPTR